jgi:hypothetical protein
MKDFRQHEEYHANEKDISSMLYFLRIFQPAKATREEAVNFLKYLGTIAHEKVANSPDKDLEKLYIEFTKSNSEE